jgi:hypothetical protein
MLEHARPARALMIAIVMVPAALSGACSEVSSSSLAPATSAAAASPTPQVSPSDHGSEVTPIDGIYQLTVTKADAVAAGIPSERLVESVGDYELDLVRGQVHVFFTHTITLDGLIGTYAVDGDTVRLISGDGDLHETYRWVLHHGELQLTLLKTDQPGARRFDELTFTTHPWERTG